MAGSLIEVRRVRKQSEVSFCSFEMAFTTRPSTPLDDAYCAWTVCIARCITLCANKLGGTRFDLALYSAFVSGSTKAPIFAIKLAFPASYSVFNTDKLGWIPNLLHG